MSLTWVGHASFLIQLGGLNILTDPMWSERASPVQFAGPRRRAAPGIPFDDLPPVDLVLLSHDHYDHLDDWTVRAIATRHSRAHWFVPLGLSPFVEQRGAQRTAEFDWWQQQPLGSVELTFVPAQHFSSRGLGRNSTLWGGWVLKTAQRALYFVGDTGSHPAFGEIGARCGPFDIVMMPIGAYEPRWFMAPVHVDPDEAVAAFTELSTATRSTRRSTMVAMHWGTFKLTDEPMSEPPTRVRRAWQRAGLPAENLRIVAIGETQWLDS